MDIARIVADSGSNGRSGIRGDLPSGFGSNYAQKRYPPRFLEPAVRRGTKSSGSSLKSIYRVTLLSVLPFFSCRSLPRTKQALASCPQAGESDRYAKLRACNEVTRDRNQLSCGSVERFDLRLSIFSNFPEIFWRVIFNDRRISVARDRLERGTRPCSFVRGGVVDIQAVHRTRIRNCREEGEGMDGRRCLERFRIERSLIYRGRWRASINEILTSAANVTTVCPVESFEAKRRSRRSTSGVSFAKKKKKIYAFSLRSNRAIA